MPVSESGFSSNGPSPILQGGGGQDYTEEDAYVGLRVDLQTIGCPYKRHKRGLLAFGEIPPVGTQRLASKCARKATGSLQTARTVVPPNQWTGEFKTFRRSKLL
jgi:hypothetical protein